MEAPPPTPITEGLHLAGTRLGMGKTASWIYPFVILRKDFTCVKYPLQDPITGQMKQTLSTPSEGDEADYFWPAWDKTVDYSSPSTKPYCNWRVSYNDLYYEPTFWLSPTQIGQEPAKAEAKVGDLVNIHEDFGQQVGRPNKTRCKNQSHPVRCWKCIGSLLENNQWRNDFWYTDYDPVSQDRKHDFVPVFLNEYFFDPSQAGGDGPRGYYEEHYPSPRKLREVVYDPENDVDNAFGKRVGYKHFEGTKSRYEPVFWDPTTGNMPTKDIACGNPYLPFQGDTIGDVRTGISVNLWYQKVTTKQETQKTVKPGNGPAQGVTISYKNFQISTITSYLVPDTRTHIVDAAPGSGLSFYYYDPNSGQGYNFASVYGALIGQPTSQQGGTPPNYWSYSQIKIGLYAITTHPLVWTRKLGGIVEERTFTTINRRYYPPNETQTQPPPYTVLLQDVTASFAYAKAALQMGENQIAVGLPDKNGKYIYDNQANQLGTVSLYDYYSYSELTTITKTKQIVGYPIWSDD